MQVNPLVYLDATQVEHACRALDPVRVVTKAFEAIMAGDAEVAPEAALRWTAADGTAARSLALPARYGEARGCKIINACIGNPRRGLPRAHGLILLFDPDTAMPVCVMDAAYISALRTAAVSVAALLAVRGSGMAGRHVAFVSCGKLARAHADLLAAHLTIERVSVHDAVEEHAAAFAAELRQSIPATAVEVATSPEAAMRDAAVVVAATTTTLPYAELRWLAKGATFFNVSLDDATEEMLTGCEHLFVDDWRLVSDDQTRLLGRLASRGMVTGPGSVPPPGARNVDAELPQLLCGGYRRSVMDEDRVVVNPFGMGVHDVAFAAHVYETAHAGGIGTWLAR